MSPSTPSTPVRWALATCFDVVTGLMALQDKYDALIIPGGMGGAVTMAGSTEVQNLVGTYYNHPEKRIIGMICAGMLLISTGRHPSFMNVFFSGSKVAITAKLPGQPITSHPSVQNEFPDRESRRC